MKTQKYIRTKGCKNRSD